MATRSGLGALVAMAVSMWACLSDAPDVQSGAPSPDSGAASSQAPAASAASTPPGPGAGTTSDAAGGGRDSGSDDDGGGGESDAGVASDAGAPADAAPDAVVDASPDAAPDTGAPDAGGYECPGYKRWTIQPGECLYVSGGTYVYVVDNGVPDCSKVTSDPLGCFTDTIPASGKPYTTWVSIAYTGAAIYPAPNGVCPKQVVNGERCPNFP